MTTFNDDLLQNAPENLAKDASIANHARWICENLYPPTYKDGSLRLVHDPKHVSRAAKNGLMLANLRRRHADTAALKLTDEDMLLIQIAILLHDSGREDEGEDLWDNDSAINLYKYLTIIMNIDHDTAKRLSEATANKDFYPDNPKKPYQELIIDNKKEPMFVDSKKTPPRTIEQKLIHDADCLDIHRARYIFDATYLDFYQEYCDDNLDSLPFKDLMVIIGEVKQIINHYGDLPRSEAKGNQDQTHYDNYEQLSKDFRTGDPPYYAIRQLTEDDRLLDQKNLQELLLDIHQTDPIVGDTLTIENVRHMLTSISTPYLLFRGIGYPSADPNHTKYQSYAHREIKKLLREGRGNEARSVTLLPCETYIRAGLLLCIDEKTICQVTKVSEKDFGSGVGKKLSSRVTEKDNSKIATDLQHLSYVAHTGMSSQFSLKNANEDNILIHNELLVDITKKITEGIAFHRDYCTFSSDHHPAHPDAGLLEAYYLQLVYLHESGDTLPIFEISHYSNHCHEIHTLTENRIVNAWKGVVSAYLTREMNKGNRYLLLTQDIEHIKTVAVYGSTQNKFNLDKIKPADYLYNEELRVKINTEIKKIKEQTLYEYKNSFQHCAANYNPDLHPNTVQYVANFCHEHQLSLHELLTTLLAMQSTSQYEQKKQQRSLIFDFFEQSMNDETSWLAQIIYRNDDGYAIHPDKLSKCLKGAEQLTRHTECALRLLKFCDHDKSCSAINSIIDYYKQYIDNWQTMKHAWAGINPYELRQVLIQLFEMLSDLEIMPEEKLRSHCSDQFNQLDQEVTRILNDERSIRDILRSSRMILSKVNDMGIDFSLAKALVKSHNSADHESQLDQALSMLLDDGSPITDDLTSTRSMLLHLTKFSHTYHDGKHFTLIKQRLSMLIKEYASANTKISLDEKIALANIALIEGKDDLSLLAQLDELPHAHSFPSKYLEYLTTMEPYYQRKLADDPQQVFLTNIVDQSLEAATTVDNQIRFFEILSQIQKMTSNQSFSMEQRLVLVERLHNHCKPLIPNLCLYHTENILCCFVLLDAINKLPETLPSDYFFKTGQQININIWQCSPNIKKHLRKFTAFGFDFDQFITTIESGVNTVQKQLSFCSNTFSDKKISVDAFTNLVISEVLNSTTLHSKDAIEYFVKSYIKTTLTKITKANTLKQETNDNRLDSPRAASKLDKKQDEQRAELLKAAKLLQQRYRQNQQRQQQVDNNELKQSLTVIF